MKGRERRSQEAERLLQYLYFPLKHFLILLCQSLLYLSTERHLRCGAAAAYALQAVDAVKKS